MKKEPLTANLKKSLAISGPWKRRERAENEAVGVLISPMQQPCYIPPKQFVARANAGDFLSKPSKGLPT